MPVTGTARHNLPYLAVGQAQKEITHNEALALIDALVHPAVESELSAPPALADADRGKCWLIGSLPTAEWSGKTGQVALWVGGGWRYLPPTEGMRLRRLNDGVDLIRSANQWLTPPAIANPANGTVIDAEARQAIAALLSYFRQIGQVAA